MTTPLVGIAEEQRRLEQGALLVAGLRLVLATLAIAVTAALEASARVDSAPAHPELFGWHPMYSAAIGYCIVEVVYLFLLRYARAVERTAALVAGGLAADILLASALVYLTGVQQSAYLPLLFVWIIAAAAVLSGRMAFAAASLAVFCLSVGLILRHLGVAPGGIAYRPLATAGLWRAGAFHLAQSGAFFAVAYLTGALARHLAEAQLVADQVLVSLQEGLVVLDRSLSVRFANNEARRLLGVKLATGQPIDEALAGDRLAEVREILTSRQDVAPRLVTLPGAGGERDRALAVSGAPVRSRRGAFRGLIAVVSDRSAEQQLEAARLLAEQRRTVSELAMSIAHEIRNPLGAVRSAVQEIGQQGELTSSGRELVEVVLSESDRLDRIVTDFLTFARPRPAKATALRARNLAAEVLDVISRGVPADRKIKVINEVPEGVVLVADAEQLRQALLNLGLNAVAATNKSGRIRIGAREERLEDFLAAMSPARRARSSADESLDASLGRTGLVLVAEDDGAGMDEETLRRAGEPFFTTRPGGTGLGLAIVERVAAAHGGAVNINSAPGQGTTVEIWLPAGGEDGADG